MADTAGPALAASPLLETKVYIPKWRAGLVPRERLIERLDRGIQRKLTVVSAPAGFGKTTLLAEWLAATTASEWPGAWVSLDQSDSDPARFWEYFIAALQTIQSGVGKNALSLLHSPQPPPIESVLTMLINEINAIRDDFALILDDYHVIDADLVHDAVTYLVDHLPPQMHLVIASRADPPLPLALLRGRSELTELRAADLRFTPEEAAEFLNQVMGLKLSAGDVAALEARTEGWIAGLQLAALSMRGRDDLSEFIRAFAGNDRYIADYLVEEVLQGQSERVRSFLLQTSILDRLCGPLCDVVTGQEDGKGMLEALERSNLFVVPLDDKRQWYRYHHLFADVLHAHLREEQPDQVPIRHRRASDWYEHNGLPSEAIRHALVAEDFQRAAGLVELAWGAMDRNFQYPMWLGWVKAVPDELVRSMPVLSVGYAWALLIGGAPESAESRLGDAERWLDNPADMSDRLEASSDEMVVVDEVEFRTLPATIASARAYQAAALGDVPGTVKHARRALDLFPADEHFERAVLAVFLGAAYWASGDLEAAHRSLADVMASVKTADHRSFAIGASYLMADVRMAQGRLNEAAGAYEQSLQLVLEQGESAPDGAAELYVGLSELNRERDNLEAAAQYLLKSKELREQAGLQDNEFRWCVAMAQIQAARGDLAGAFDLLREAERVYKRSPIPYMRPLGAMKIRIRVAQGRLTETLDWERERTLSVDDELSYMREYEHVTLARVLIAWYRSDRSDRFVCEAMGLLERLLRAAEKGERTGSVIEILVLQALAHGAQGNIPSALVPLERALALAEPEGFVRVIVDEGEPMRILLRHAAARGGTSSYIRQLLSAFDRSAQPGSTSFQAAAADLLEPLTGREVEILRLVAAGMRNQEIADQLFISLATVKRHIANAYGKLSVSNRIEAIAKANEPNLL